MIFLNLFHFSSFAILLSWFFDLIFQKILSQLFHLYFFVIMFFSISFIVIFSSILFFIMIFFLVFHLCFLFNRIIFSIIFFFLLFDFQCFYYNTMINYKVNIVNNVISYRRISFDLKKKLKFFTKLSRSVSMLYIKIHHFPFNISIWHSKNRKCLRMNPEIVS